MDSLSTGSGDMDALSTSSNATLQKFLLGCGIASSLLYVIMNIVGALMWENYSFFSGAVSEFGAIGAPSRILWCSLGIIYQILITAFGIGIWISADQNRWQRVTGALLAGYGAVGLLAPLFPMHMRGVKTTYTDTMHIVLTMVTVLFMFLAIGFSVAAFGGWFRVYSIATAVVLLVFGGWSATFGSRVAANLPTPWFGVLERINIGVFLLWVIVLAVTLLLRQPDSSET